MESTERNFNMLNNYLSAGIGFPLLSLHDLVGIAWADVRTMPYGCFSQTVVFHGPGYFLKWRFCLICQCCAFGNPQTGCAHFTYPMPLSQPAWVCLRAIRVYKSGRFGFALHGYFRLPACLIIADKLSFHTSDHVTDNSCLTNTMCLMSCGHKQEHVPG